MKFRAPIDLYIGDIVELRKSHPCGGKTWRILRVGADVGIECTNCNRYVLVPRSRFESRIKCFVKHCVGSADRILYCISENRFI